MTLIEDTVAETFDADAREDVLTVCRLCREERVARMARRAQRLAQVAPAQ